jgi:hypothetical protein
LYIITVDLSFVSKKRDAISQRFSVPRTVTKGQKRTFILTSGGPEKKRERKKDDEQKTPAYYPHSLYQPLHRTTFGLEYGGKLMRTYFKHNRCLCRSSTGPIGL